MRLIYVNIMNTQCTEFKFHVNIISRVNEVENAYVFMLWVLKDKILQKRYILNCISLFIFSLLLFLLFIYALIY